MCGARRSGDSGHVSGSPSLRSELLAISLISSTVDAIAAIIGDVGRDGGSVVMLSTGVVVAMVGDAGSDGGSPDMSLMPSGEAFAIDAVVVCDESESVSLHGTVKSSVAGASARLCFS